MPELPEVETVKNELLPHVIGRRITGITLVWEGIVKQPAAAEFCARVTGQAITAIKRRGKYLLVSLSGGDLMVLHLKMSGSLIIGRNSTEPPRFTRAVIHLDNDSSVFFRDPRKFGMMKLVEDEKSAVGKLGPEPLEDVFTPRLLSKLLDKRTAPIKALLCDQTVIAGIGNMYADEVLFAAGIHPLRTAVSLSREEIKKIHTAIRRILKTAIANKGASVDTYFRPDGTKGTAHFEFKVAHRRGENCLNCGTALQRITVRNRGTYFCPKCQPE